MAYLKMFTDISQENRLKFIRIKKIPLNKKSNNIINQIENDENDKNKKNDIICQKKKQKTKKHWKGLLRVSSDSPDKIKDSIEGINIQANFIPEIPKENPFLQNNIFDNNFIKNSLFNINNQINENTFNLDFDDDEQKE